MPCAINFGRAFGPGIALTHAVHPLAPIAPHAMPGRGSAGGTAWQEASESATEVTKIWAAFITDYCVFATGTSASVRLPQAIVTEPTGPACSGHCQRTSWVVSAWVAGAGGGMARSRATTCTG